MLVLKGIMANCLLFCGRYEDTEILQNPENNQQRMLLINAEHFPNIRLPVGELSDGISCRRLAMIYYKRQEMEKPPTAKSFAKNPTRKISASLALEKKMLAHIHLVAVAPAP